MLARELTKLFEPCTVHAGRGTGLARCRSEAGKGEFVLIVEGAGREKEEDGGSARRALAVLLDELPLKQAVNLAAKITGGKKNELYRMALAMRKKRDS